MIEEDIFHRALEKPTLAEQLAFLDQVCADQPELRQRVERLLRSHRHEDSFLHAPVTADEVRAETTGTVIGPYKLLQQIGEGGMGTVFMAEQTQPVQRKVALKIIKPGMDSRQVIARFEAERQALAMMDHVNIARVLDAGATQTGRPYFVMELVHGVPITKYCDDNHLTPRERLELFVPVCLAIQHAHQKGIIHRDVKPSNIMITLYDGKPAPKVIDFGVAKATEQKLTERTLFTQYGTMVGTLEYMSPEQAETSAVGVDTRSDIYSLGVLLYELLTGTPPLSHKRLKEAAYAEILRMIKEEEPQKPSTRLSESRDTLPAISAQRHMEPHKLTKLVRGELDWIVMKALEKDRNRRYETANGLAADVRHYLADEPVEACPPSQWYRLRKFAQRYRAAIATAGLFVLVLVAAVVYSAWQAIQAQRARNQAELRRNEAETNLRKARQAVQEQFTMVSQSKLLEVPGLQQLRKDLLESALRYYEDFLQQRPDDPALLAEVAAAHLRLYQIYQALDASTSARAIVPLAKAIDILERLLREYPANAGIYTPLAGFARPGRALHLLAAPHANYEVALPLFQRVTSMWEEFVRDNPAEPGFQFDLAEFYGYTHELQVDAPSTSRRYRQLAQSPGSSPRARPTQTRGSRIP
jgi:serine/threonine protein kinase